MEIFVDYMYLDLEKSTHDTVPVCKVEELEVYMYMPIHTII